MMSFLPVVAADGHVGQAGVTWDVDSIRIGVKFSRTTAAAGVDDVTGQHRHYTVQWCGAVEQRSWCILGSVRMLELKGDNLDSELHSSYERTGKRVSKGFPGRAPRVWAAKADSSDGSVLLTAVFLGQQCVEVQFDATSCPDGWSPVELLCLGVSGVQGLDRAPGGGVKFREFRGQTLPHQEVAEVPDRRWRKSIVVIWFRLLSSD